MSLTESQIQAIDVTEKVGSVFSVLGEAFVISTFLLSSKFRKPINRLVFYATWGNILSNVATLIGRSASGIGLDSPLCQFQSFLIQWFMPADALWTFAMALNVWLSFFHHYDTPKLRALEWKYLLFCYGLPFPPAFVFLFISTRSLGRVYGDAVLWCWVSVDWDFLRVAVFYAPVWVIILLTIAIYVRVGILICKWRRELLQLDHPPRHEDRHSQLNTPVNGIRRTDEVTITREATTEHVPYSPFRNRPIVAPSLDKHELSFSERLRDRVSTIGRHNRRSGSRSTLGDASKHANKSTIKYCKCAVLFFIALFVTWVPSTINRIYTLFYPDRVVFGLQFAAALVLPLQGFWNAVIYVATSGYACRCMWKDIAIFLGLHKPIVEDVPMRRRGLSFDSRGGWQAESDTTSLKPTQTL